MESEEQIAKNHIFIIGELYVELRMVKNQVQMLQAKVEELSSQESEKKKEE